MTQSKTPGQLAYEAELLICPNYHDGAPRHAWDKLADHVKASWEKNPSPREWVKKHAPLNENGKEPFGIKGETPEFSEAAEAAFKKVGEL